MTSEDKGCDKSVGDPNEKSKNQFTAAPSISIEQPIAKLPSPAPQPGPNDNRTTPGGDPSDPMNVEVPTVWCVKGSYTDNTGEYLDGNSIYVLNSGTPAGIGRTDDQFASDLESSGVPCNNIDTAMKKWKYPCEITADLSQTTNFLSVVAFFMDSSTYVRTPILKRNVEWTPNVVAGNCGGCSS